MIKFPKQKKASVNLLQGDIKLLGCARCDGGIEPKERAHLISVAAPLNVIAMFKSKALARYIFITPTAVYHSLNGLNFVKLYDGEFTSAFANEERVKNDDYPDGETVFNVYYDNVVIENKATGYSTDYYGANLSCGIFHCGRLFGADKTDGNILRWSGEGGARDFADKLYGSGYLRLDGTRGKIIDVKKLGANLIVVRENGFTKLKAFGSPELFSASDISTPCERILKNTAQAVGDRLYFMTESGIKVLYGNDISEVDCNSIGDISEGICSASFDGSYYLGCESSEFGKGIVCIETGKPPVFLGEECESMCASDKLYFCRNGSFYSLEKGENIKVVIKGVNFSSSKNKILKEVTLNCSDPKITVSLSGKSKTFLSAKAKTHIRGDKFDIILEGKGKLTRAAAEASIGI